MKLSLDSLIDSLARQLFVCRVAKALSQYTAPD
jgi:hypothetical protein